MRSVRITEKLTVAGQPAITTFPSIAEDGFGLVINNRPDGEDPGQLPAAEARRLATAHGIAYHHIPVTAATLSRADVDAFAAVLRDAPAPVVAHCRSGTRSALLWALARLRDGADPLSLIAAAARHGIDIAGLPAVAARLR